jgi:hypothetical protein
MCDRPELSRLDRARRERHQGRPDKRRRSSGCCNRLARSRRKAGSPRSPLCTRRCGLRDGNAHSHAADTGGASGAGGQLHPASLRRKLVDALRPVLPVTQADLEYDGRQHSEDTEQWLHVLKRREALDRMGWRVIVITRRDYYDAPEEVLRRVRDALLERGMVGVRRRFKPEWARHIVGA